MELNKSIICWNIPLGLESVDEATGVMFKGTIFSIGFSDTRGMLIELEFIPNVFPEAS